MVVGRVFYGCVAKPNPDTDERRCPAPHCHRTADTQRYRDSPTSPRQISTTGSNAVPTATPTTAPSVTPAAVKALPSPEATQSANVSTEKETQDRQQTGHDRAILLLDLAATNREESLVTVGVRTDGRSLGTVAPAPGAVWSPDGSRFRIHNGRWRLHQDWQSGWG